MIPRNREEFKEYILTRLGGGSNPVIEINISSEQLEDRIDDAIQYANEWHMEGTELLYTHYKMQASHLLMDASFPVDTLKRGMSLYGTISQNYATIVDQPEPSKVRFYLADQAKPMFQPGEPMIVNNGQYVFNVQNISTGVYLGDFEKRYIEIPSDIISVVKIFPLQLSNSSYFLFDGQYHMISDVLYNFGAQGLTSYLLTKEYLNLVQEMISGQKPIRFNSMQGKLYLDIDWTHVTKPDDFIIIQCYKCLNPEVYTNFWNNRFLKDYTTTLVKLQWADNLSKYSNIQMLGGVTLNAEAMRTEALTEKKDLERRMGLEFSQPLGFFVA